MELPYLISTRGRAPSTGGPELSPHRDVGSATILKVFIPSVLLLSDTALGLQIVDLEVLSVILLGLFNLTHSFPAFSLCVLHSQRHRIYAYAFFLLEVTTYLIFAPISQYSRTWHCYGPRASEWKLP